MEVQIDFLRNELINWAKSRALAYCEFHPYMSESRKLRELLSIELETLDARRDFPIFVMPQSYLSEKEDIVTKYAQLIEEMVQKELENIDELNYQKCKYENEKANEFLIAMWEGWYEDEDSKVSHLKPFVVELKKYGIPCPHIPFEQQKTSERVLCKKE